MSDNESRRFARICHFETVKRLCCDGQAIAITEYETGTPLGIGRKSRIVPKAIQRAVRARDNDRCTFPGCNHHRFLQCHHVEHWSNGGETSLDNLLLLCTKHHAGARGRLPDREELP
ncbi:MAG: HNH endonuclease [Gammaproteobacteria bacterium]|nr:HNH endonuclease [Gammaproteobacteria bacterium]